MGTDSSGEHGQGRRRGRQPAPRRHRVGFVLTDEEYAAVQAAAGRAGLARGAYAAQVVLAAAQEKTPAPGADEPRRVALRELMRASGLVHRIGVNLNQAVAKLNATGQRSGDLLPYAAESTRCMERLDAAADQVRRALGLGGWRDREDQCAARAARGPAALVPVRARPPRRAHRPAPGGRVAAPRRTGTPAAAGRQTGLPAADRAAEAAAGPARRPRVCAAGVALRAARRASQDRMLSDEEWAVRSPLT
jgi:hypothetical protein